MLLRDATEADLPAILKLHNHEIRTGTALWSEAEVDLEDRRAWLRARWEAGFPVVCAVDGDTLLGFGSYGPWRGRDCYRFTVEHSVYVVPEAQGRGVGGALLALLIERADAQGYHAMIGAVEASNTASRRLHEKHGFFEAGRMRQTGYKFGRWMDLLFMQRLLGQA